MENIKCLECSHGSINNIGGLYCNRFKEVLCMNPQLLLQVKHNGSVRAFKVKERIDNCEAFKVKSRSLPRE